MSPSVQQGEVHHFSNRERLSILPRAGECLVKPMKSLATKPLPLSIIYNPPSIAEGLVREGEKQVECGEPRLLQISYLGVFLFLELAASDDKHIWCLFAKNFIYTVKTHFTQNFHKKTNLPSRNIITLSVKSRILLLLSISMSEIIVLSNIYEGGDQKKRELSSGG